MNIESMTESFQGQKVLSQAEINLLKICINNICKYFSKAIDEDVSTWRSQVQVFQGLGAASCH